MEKDITYQELYKRLQLDFPDRTCKFWCYKHLHTYKDMGEEVCPAFGLNYKGEIIFFDLLSYSFIITIHQTELLSHETYRNDMFSSFVDFIVNAVKRRDILKYINHSQILQTHLMTDDCYRSGNKVFRILYLKVKKHKLIISFTIGEREVFHKIVIHDSMKDYQGLVQALKKYKEYTDHLCPRCGQYMENAYCNNCYGLPAIYHNFNPYGYFRYPTLNTILMLISLLAYIIFIAVSPWTEMWVFSKVYLLTFEIVMCRWAELPDFLRSLEIYYTWKNYIENEPNEDSE